MIQALLAIVGVVAVLKYLSDQGSRESKGHADAADGLHAQGRHAEAADEYGEAIRHDPQNAQLYSRRGRALWGAGRRRDALGDYVRASEIDADSAAAHCDVASALRLMGHPSQALASAERAVSLSGQSARAHRIRGEALRDLDEDGKAIDAFKASADLHDTAEIRVRLAEVRCGRGEHEYERRELDRAIELEAGSADLHYRRARALLHIAGDDPGRAEECRRGAVADLERARGIDPRHEEAGEMLRRARAMPGGEPGGG